MPKRLLQIDLLLWLMEICLPNQSLLELLKHLNCLWQSISRSRYGQISTFECFFFSICNNIVVVVLQINSHFSDKLLGVIRDMVVHTKSIDISKKNDQSSEKQRGDATLEFIKHTCAVLALDQTVQHDVLVNCYIFSCLLLSICCFSVSILVFVFSHR